MTQRTERSQRFESAIAGFLAARREEKLKGKDPDASAEARYDYRAWLSDAARRVSQIRAVTHVLKATHPDAKGSSLRVTPDTLPQHAEIGSHSLGADYAEDVVGNAAALDVFKFLKLEVDGRRLLDWMMTGDADLEAALHPDPETSASWRHAFSTLATDTTQPSSHVLAKQVYWLVGEDPAEDADFHLLQPLFSSSLTHAVHTDIDDARFGDANKAARDAFRKREAYGAGYRDYRRLAVRKLGGTKPQNISQLNSERRGVNYLLASLPPQWRSEATPSPLGVDSALQRFCHFAGVQAWLKRFAAFLRADPEPTVETRQQREQQLQALTDQLGVFAAEIRANWPPGWSRDPECRLPDSERLWLDPERVDLPTRATHEAEDAAFIEAYHRGGWADEVAAYFAKWLNAELRARDIQGLGDAEARHFASHVVLDAAWPVPLARRLPGAAA